MTSLPSLRVALQQKNMKQLKKYAKECDLKNYSRCRKRELIERVAKCQLSSVKHIEQKLTRKQVKILALASGLKVQKNEPKRSILKKLAYTAVVSGITLTAFIGTIIGTIIYMLKRHQIPESSRKLQDAFSYVAPFFPT